MRRPAVILLALALAPLAHAATSTSVSFHAPARLGGATTATVPWALVVFGSEDQASFNATSPGGADLNDTLVSLVQPNGKFGGNQGAAGEDVPLSGSVQGFASSVNYDGIGSLYLSGNVVVHAQDAHVELLPMHGGTCLNQVVKPKDFEQLDARYNAICPPEGVVATLTGDMDVHVEGANLTDLEWHHAQFSCQQTPCPDGGQRTVITQDVAGTTVTNKVLGYHHLSTHDSVVSGGGKARRIYFGGPRIDLGVAGWMELPLATTHSCQGCVVAQNQTLSIQGNPELVGLHRESDHDLAAQLGGSAVAARVDETLISPSLLFAAGATTTVAVVATLAIAGAVRLLAALFSRLQQAELSPKRRAILDVIVQHPGINMAQLAETAGLPLGTLRHHLKMLQNGGHIVERRQGRSRCFFENHGRYGQEWVALAVLHKAKLRELHDLLKHQPGLTPAQVCHATQERWGWQRSATHKRLRRLEKAGLVQRQPGPEIHLVALDVPNRAQPSVSPGI